MKDTYTQELFPEAIVKMKRYIPGENENACVDCKRQIGVCYDKQHTGEWYKCNLHGVTRGASVCEDHV